MNPEEFRNLKVGDELVSVNDVPFFTRGIRVVVKSISEWGPRIEGIKNGRVYDKGIPNAYMDYYKKIKKAPKTLMDLKV
jgi:hypothetical protein